MAILKQRLSKRMSDGSLAPVHLETSSDLVLRPDGTTVEDGYKNLYIGNLRPIDGIEYAYTPGKGSVIIGHTDWLETVDVNYDSHCQHCPSIAGTSSLILGMRNRCLSTDLIIGDINRLDGHTNLMVGQMNNGCPMFSAIIGNANEHNGQASIIIGDGNISAGSTGIVSGIGNAYAGRAGVVCGRGNAIGSFVLNLSAAEIISRPDEQYTSISEEVAQVTVKFTIDRDKWCYNQTRSTCTLDNLLSGLVGKSSISNKNPTSTNDISNSMVLLCNDYRTDYYVSNKWYTRYNDFKVLSVSDDKSSITIEFNIRYAYGSELDSYFSSNRGPWELICVRAHNGSSTAAFETDAAFIAGRSCIATASYSQAFGVCTHTGAEGQMVIGKANIRSTSSQDKFIVGKGSPRSYESQENGLLEAITRSNCFRVTDTGVYANGNYNASGADYAEMFEWADANPSGEDRVGRFVTLDGDKIRLASHADDFILGIVSGNPSIVGDVHDDQWQGMYLYDVYGRPIFETVEIPEWSEELPNDPTNPESGTHTVVHPAHFETQQKVNPDYNNAEKYQSRSSRPEWAAIGLMGKLIVNDDGTAQINGYVAVANDGIATDSPNKTKYRVMKRLDDTHIQIMILP